MIAIPSHPCLPCDPAREAPTTYGELGADNVATCSLRVRWGTGERAPGCGARIALCHGCGLRTRINGAPCGACGGTVYPGASQVLTREPARASGADVDPTRSIVQGETTADTAGSRAEKGRPPKRAPAKRARKVAAPEGPTLPGVK